MQKRLPALTLHAGLLLVILAVAALLRFQNLHAIEHNVDHAYPIWQAMMTLDRGIWPITAQGTSVLFANPALTGYLFVLPVALTRSPYGPYLLVITLNTLAVWLAYRAAALLLDERRALIAAFLLAINPWVIEYSRTTWVQSLMPFFACLVFWLLAPIWLGKASRPGRRMILAAVALAAMTQTYLLNFVILLPVGLLCLIFRRRIPWRAALIGGAVLVVTTGIYGLGLLNDVSTFSRLREFSQGAAHLSSEAWSHAVRLVTGRDYAAARGMDAPAGDAALRDALSEVAHIVILVALLAGIGAAGYAIWRHRLKTDSGRVGVMTLLWFGLPVALMSYVSRPVHPFYLLLTLPAGHILAAWGAGFLLERRTLRFVLVMGAVLIAIISALNTLRFAEATLAHPGAPWRQLGALPVGAGIEMTHTLLPPQTPGAVVFADVDEWTLNSLAGELFPVDRDVDTARTTYIPAGGGTYLIFRAPGDSSAEAPIGASDAARYTLADSTFVQSYRVLPGSNNWWTASKAIKGDAGITYLGCEVEGQLARGQTAMLLTAWRVDALQPDRGNWLFGPFVHVYDSSGKRVAIADGAVTPGAVWRQGDIHLKRIAVSIPADATGPFTLQVGQYDGVHNRNVIFTLPDGSMAATIPITLTK